MAEHERAVGESDEWYTPKFIFDALGCQFDLDPCSPGNDHWVPATRVYTKDDDGLNKDWEGFVFMNPPFGGRLGHIPWLRKFISHADGIAIVRAYTSSGWFHDYVDQFDALCFPRGKTQFVRPDGSVGRSPGHGIVLVARGRKAVEILRKCDLGWFVEGDKYDPTRTSTD